MDRVTVVILRSERREGWARGEPAPLLRFLSRAVSSISIVVHVVRALGVRLASDLLSSPHAPRMLLRSPDDDAEADDRLGQERLESRDVLGDVDASAQGGGQLGNIRTLWGGEEPFEPTGRCGVGILEAGEDRSSAIVDDDNLKVRLLLTESSTH